MQTVQQLQPFTNGNNKRPLSSFELITNWIDTGYTLNLAPNTIQLMTVLLRFYNPQKKYVFPHQSTIAERTNTSLATVKRCLNELIKAQLIIKTRTQKGNVYGFTPKLFELLHSSNSTIPTAQNEPCMHEQIKGTNKRTTTTKKAEETKPQKDVVVSISNFSFKRVPASILAKKTDKNGKPIRSHEAYWNSFSDEQKREYLKTEEAEAERQKKRAELKKQREIEEMRKRAEEEANRKAFETLPIEERQPKAQVIRTIWNLRNFIKQGKKPLSYLNEAIAHYNLDYIEIAEMTSEELETYINK